MRWTSRTMARHDSVAVGNALRRKSIENCSFSCLKPRIFACGARAAGCAGESVFLDHARVNRLSTTTNRMGVVTVDHVHRSRRDGDSDSIAVPSVPRLSCCTTYA